MSRIVDDRAADQEHRQDAAALQQQQMAAARNISARPVSASLGAKALGSGGVSTPREFVDVGEASNSLVQRPALAPDQISAATLQERPVDRPRRSNVRPGTDVPEFVILGKARASEILATPNAVHPSAAAALYGFSKLGGLLAMATSPLIAAQAGDERRVGIYRPMGSADEAVDPVLAA